MPPPRPRLSVTFLIGQLGRGGTERQLYLLARGLAENDVAVRVASLYGGGPYVDALEAAGVEVYPGQFPTWREDGARVVARLPRRIAALIRWMRAHQPDVVHAFLFHAYVFAPLVARCARVPVLVTGRRSLGDFKEEFPLVKTLEAVVNLGTDAVVANSGAVAEDTARREWLVRRKLRVIPNAVAPEMFLAASPADLPTDLPVVLCVANLRSYKGHEVVLAACADLAAMDKPVTMVFAGDGPGLEDLRTRAGQLGVDARFLGDRDDIPQLLAAADVVVSASFEEGMPNAVLEAMAASRAVVATDVGGTREALGDAGVLVPARDPDALAAAVARLLDDPAERRRLAASARRRAEDFTVKALVDRHLRLYREFLS